MAVSSSPVLQNKLDAPQLELYCLTFGCYPTGFSHAQGVKIGTGLRHVQLVLKCCSENRLLAELQSSIV